MRNILITGGVGFIGSNFVNYLLSNYYNMNITIVDKLTYAADITNLEYLNKVKLLNIDICDINKADYGLKNTDAIIHIAAESHVDRSIKDEGPFIKSNIIGTVELLKYALNNNIKRFVYISTDEVYGDLSDGRTAVESDRLYPRNLYSASKASAEHFVLAYHETFGLDVVITRGCNTYGKYQYPEKIIPLFIINTVLGKDLPLYGDGSAKREYMHVYDHCRGIELALFKGKSGEIYNFSTGYEFSGNEVAQKILDYFGASYSRIKYVEDRLGHDYRYSICNIKAKNELGWESRIEFDDGLEDTIEWYINNRSWWRNKIS